MSTLSIQTYGNGEAILHVLNGVVAIFTNPDYVALLQALMAFTGAMLMVMATGTWRISVMGKWFFTFIFIYFIAFVPRVDVMVVDRVDPVHQNGVVANVPYGVAGLLWITNNTGTWVAEQLETVMTLPNDQRYAENGMLFGASLIARTPSLEIENQDLAYSLSEFFQQCVFQGIHLGFLSAETLHKTDDIWQYLEGRVSKNAFFEYRGPTRQQLVACRADQVEQSGYDWLTSDLALEEVRISKRFGQKLFGDRVDTPAEAQMRFELALSGSYQYLADISRSAGGIVRQLTLHKAVQRAIVSNGADADAGAAATDFAQSVAEVQRREAWQLNAALSDKMLPMMRAVFEVIIVAVFPIVFLMMMLPFALKVVSMYVKLLIWLQLWAPVSVLTHSLGMIWAKNAVSASSLLDNGNASLSAATMSDMAFAAADMAAIANYTGAMVPALAGIMVFGSGMIFANVASGIGSVSQHAAAQAAGESARGNISLGNLSTNNASAFKNDWSATDLRGFGASDQGLGMTSKLAVGGPAALNNSSYQHQVGLSSLFSNQRVAGMKQEANQAYSAAIGAAKQVMDKAASTYGEFDQFIQTHGKEHSRSDGVQQSRGFDRAQAMGSVKSYAQELGRRYSLDDITAGQIVGGVAMGLKSAAILAPQGKVDGSNSSHYLEAIGEVRKALSDTKFGSEVRTAFGVNAKHGTEVGEQVNDQWSDSLSSQWAKAREWVDSANSNMSRAVSAQSAANWMQTYGINVSANMDSAAFNALADKYANGDQQEMVRRINETFHKGDVDLLQEYAGFVSTHLNPAVVGGGLNTGYVGGIQGESWVEQFMSKSGLALPVPGQTSSGLSITGTDSDTIREYFETSRDVVDNSAAKTGLGERRGNEFANSVEIEQGALEEHIRGTEEVVNAATDSGANVIQSKQVLIQDDLAHRKEQSRVVDAAKEYAQDNYNNITEDVVEGIGTLFKNNAFFDQK